MRVRGYPASHPGCLARPADFHRRDRHQLIERATACHNLIQEAGQTWQSRDLVQLLGAMFDPAK
jgi:hypothetical protein